MESKKTTAVMDKIRNNAELLARADLLAEDEEREQLKQQRAELIDRLDESNKKVKPTFEELLELTDKEKEEYSLFFNKLPPQKHFVFNMLVSDLWLLQSLVRLENVNVILMDKLSRQENITNELLDQAKENYDILHDAVRNPIYSYVASRIINAIKTALADENIGLTGNNLKTYISFLRGVIKSRTRKGNKDRSKNDIKQDMSFLVGYIKLIQKGIDEYKQQINIPALIAKIPEDRVMANTKLSNVMDRQPSLFDDILEIRVSRETDKKPIYTQVQLVYENTDIEIQAGQNNFSPFDRAVHDSVVSIYASGQKTFTPETVYRAMAGKKESKYADPKTIAEVSASIEKSLRIRASIDITKEAEARGYDLSDNPKIKEGTRATMSDTLLSARKLQLRTGGTVKTGYIFNATPILYDYALLSKQIISVKSYLLDVSSAINMTNEVMVIRDYLHREIEIMKNPKSDRNAKIAYKSIYEYLNITPEHHANINNKRLKIRNTVKKILKYQTSKKYIKGWTEYKIGKELGGVIIDY